MVGTRDVGGSVAFGAGEFAPGGGDGEATRARPIAGGSTAAPTPSPSAGVSSSATRVADHVEEMMERLRLTAVEAKPVVLDDEDEADLVALDCGMLLGCWTTFG